MRLRDAVRSEVAGKRRSLSGRSDDDGNR